METTFTFSLLLIYITLITLFLLDFGKLLTFSGVLDMYHGIPGSFKDYQIPWCMNMEIFQYHVFYQSVMVLQWPSILHQYHHGTTKVFYYLFMTLFAVITLQRSR